MLKEITAVYCFNPMNFVALDLGYIHFEHLTKIGAIDGITHFKYYPIPPVDEQEIIARIGDAELVTGRVYCKINKHVMESAKNLKAVFTQSVGFDHIDMTIAQAKGIKVYNCPGYNSNSVAEFAFSLILSLFRKIPAAQEHVRAGGVEYRLFEGMDLKNKTIGIIGAGNVGSKIVSIAKGFGMKTLVATKNPTQERATELGIDGFTDLVKLLKYSDVIVVAVTLTPETKGLLGKKELGLIPKTSFLVNISRQTVIDELELAKKIVDGKLAGAALDLLIEDPFKLDQHPILVQEMVNMPNVIVTPHIAAETKEANYNLGVITLTNIKNYLSGVYTNCVC